LRARLFAGFLARAYRSQARDGMRLLWRAPMRSEEHGRTRIKAMERISEPIIGQKNDGEVLDDPEQPLPGDLTLKTWDRTAFIFALPADESAPVADLEGLRTRGFEIPAGRNLHRPRNLSSTAKQNDKIPQGNIYRGVGGHFRIRHSTKYFVPSRLRGPRACYHQAECLPANRF